MSLLSRLPSRSTKTQQPARRSHPRLGIEQLEAREVPAADFANAFGVGNDAGVSESYDVATDSAGNSYMTGYFSGTLDFEPASTRNGDTDILTSAGADDAFVAKYAADSSLVWAIRLGGGALDRGRSIDVDASGNVYVTGQFSGGTASFGSVALTSAGPGNDGFVTKLNPAGVVQWAKRWGQTDAASLISTGDLGKGVDTDAAGNVYVVGTRATTGTTTSSNGYDVLKFSSTGMLSWAKFVNTRTYIELTGDLTADTSGNVFVTGAFAGTVDFDPAANKTKNLFGGGAFVLKLTSSGDFGWVSSITGGSGQSITRDGNGNVIFGGFYYSSNAPVFSQYAGATFSPTGLLATSGSFVAKLTSGGGLTWAKGIEKNDIAWVYGLATDSAGSVYATGSFRGTIDLDPGAGTLIRQSVPHVNGTGNSEDIFVIKLTSTGNLDWAETFGGDKHDIAYGIAVDPSGMIHLAGGYSGTVDFDPDPLDTFYLTNTTTNRQLFLVKLRQN